MGFTELDPAAPIAVAYAYSNNPVDTPSDETSNFGIHDNLGHPVFDLAVAKNADFASKVEEL
jgi:hypothetical protein